MTVRGDEIRSYLVERKRLCTDTASMDAVGRIIEQYDALVAYVWDLHSALWTVADVAKIEWQDVKTKCPAWLSDDYTLGGEEA